MENQINVQDLFAIIGEQSLTIRLLQQRMQTMQKALDDQNKESKDRLESTPERGETSPDKTMLFKAKEQA